MTGHTQVREHPVHEGDSGSVQRGAPAVQGDLTAEPPRVFPADPGRRALELRELREGFVEERVRLIWEERVGTLGVRRTLQRAQESCDPALAPPSPRAEPVEPRRLAAIERALELLARGEYGDCARCGEPISTARLGAIPAGELCCACARSAPHA